MNDYIVVGEKYNENIIIVIVEWLCKYKYY